MKTKVMNGRAIIDVEGVTGETLTLVMRRMWINRIVLLPDGSLYSKPHGVHYSYREPKVSKGARTRMWDFVGENPNGKVFFLFTFAIEILKEGTITSSNNVIKYDPVNGFDGLTDVLAITDQRIYTRLKQLATTDQEVDEDALFGMPFQEPANINVNEESEGTVSYDFDE